MLVIAEKINATNKAVAGAIATRNEEFLVKLAVSQAQAGADYIDVNVGSGQGTKQDEMAAMQWLVKLVQQNTNKPLTIDSDSADVIEAGLEVYHGEKVMVNSVTAERDRLESVGRLVTQRKVQVVALAMGDGGIPQTAAQRLDFCKVIMEYLVKGGLDEEQVFFDPLVLPLSVDATQGIVTLKTIEMIKAEFPKAKTVVGLSNISYGLPQRRLINRSFMLAAAYAGLDAAIVDPMDPKTMSHTKIADLITGKDPSCRTYLMAHRRGKIVD
ncbi:dihydropteroate synthase [Chloroflexota bacterium]